MLSARRVSHASEVLRKSALNGMPGALTCVVIPVIDSSRALLCELAVKTDLRGGSRVDEDELGQEDGALHTQ